MRGRTMPPDVAALIRAALDDNGKLDKCRTFALAPLTNPDVSAHGVFDPVHTNQIA